MLEFKIPVVGENIKSGTIVSIAVAEGDTVKKNQDVLELETDKASLPIPSPADGVIKKILAKAGDEVKIGQVVMHIEETSGAGSAAVSPKESPKEEPKKPAAAQPKAELPQAPTPVTATAPRVAVARPALGGEAFKDVAAAPSVRRLARELGIDVSRVPGSGPGGRVSKDDVKAYTKQIVLGGVGATAPAQPSLPDFSKFGSIKREAMNNVRKKTASHLSQAWNTIPHVTQFDKADLTDLEKLRKKLSTDTMKLTVTPFLLKIMALALKEFPKFNASIDSVNHEIVYKEFYNLGVAVDTDRGLLVPVIKDVLKKSVLEIAEEVSAMAERARNRKTSLDELSGGCLTLTNLGGIGGTAFTPIVNWPEVAILGVSRGGMEPVYNKEKHQFEPRLMLPLSLSYDHRLIDGADGARFLRWICKMIEIPEEIERQKP